MFVFGGLIALIVGMIYKDTNWVLFGIGLLSGNVLSDILIELRKIRQELEK